MDIIFINQQAFFTTIEKGIRFFVLVPLSNITKEECYMALDVVMRHYKKSGFYVKRIECDSKFKSTIDEVSDDMGIEIKYSNTDYHFPESDRNNRVIKERFRIAYHWCTYK